MKSFLKISLLVVLAVVAAHLVPEVQHLFGMDPEGVAGVLVAAPPVFASFANLRNIPEQIANPAGIRRIGVVAVKDLLDTVIDWPIAVGDTPDVDVVTMTITTACPLAAGKTIAVITPADNSAFADFENQGDRYYQSFKHAMGFEIAGQTRLQSQELRKFINTGAIFFTEYNDGEIRVYGSKLSPIVLKSKGASGKKGGDKRGYTLSGDSDNFVIEPPFYPATLALPGMTSVAP